MNKKRMKTKIPVFFIAFSVVPPVALMVLFMIMPTIEAFRLSFTNSTGMGGSYDFVGLKNYIYMFQDSLFILSLKNTIKLMAVIPLITVILALIFAFVLTQTKLKERGIYRVIYFMPSIISLTVIGIIFSFIFNPTMGSLNNMLTKVGLGQLALAWLGDSRTALWCIGVTLVWQSTGYYMVMHIAAIDGISPDIMEAATIDGAGQFQKLVKIILPLLKNIIGITYVLSLSGTLALSFILSKVMTAGGPSGTSTVLLQYMYQQAFTNSNFGYAMAIAIFTLIISISLSVISRGLTNRE
ncbi:sugar ABC transporter permease [Faecalicatena orotica]|uniref:N-acetylglucosamine transport system permease protein n=1 Tax=Faecalicatena orotica TaxID=1544 RepID=A0A2Y9BDM5_9FIRM|nr:sugar ABC transporter permease [Faecalicatena orotica]PWJ28882.1 N-acetylglucosamine transport system permease protein [Faecalicatena orotica]SSA56051.1 N-acetylglucosamine transport system permease protein [Faecalicatena orotica]